jgi:hypothetical protein
MCPKSKKCRVFLDDCSAYCPEAILSASTNLQLDPAKTKKKPISSEGLDISVKRAFRELSKAREQQQDSKTMEDGGKSVVGQVITVYYRDKGGGDIHGVTVTHAEALKYMEDSLKV